MGNRIDPNQKPGELKPQTPAKPQAPAPQEAPRPKSDAFAKSDPDHQARQMAKNQELGHKIRFQAGSPAAQARAKPLRPAPAIQAQNYQRLLKDPIFRQASMRDSGLHRYLSQRSVPGEGARFPLSPNYLQRLIRMRPQVEDRPNLRQILRHEIHNHRLKEQEKAKEADAAKKGKEAAEGKDGKKEGESGFESALKRSMDGKGRLPAPPNGKSARFPSKSEAGWREFFKNVLSRGSAEQAVTKQSKSMMDSLFRGLYKAIAGQKGATLITDLKIADGNRVLTEKFARILVDNPSLLELLERMEPGDQLNRELLQQLGEELQYTKLAHASSASDQTSAQEALNQLKSQHNPLILARFENALLEERNRRSALKRQEEARGGEGQSGNFPMNPAFYSGQGLPDRLKYFGKPKWLLLLGYSMGITILALLIYGIIRSL